MNRLLMLCAILAAGCATAPPEKDWKQGGTLRKATVAEWRKADQVNKVASCADHASLHLGPNYREDPISWDTLRRRASEDLAQRLDERVAKAPPDDEIAKYMTEEVEAMKRAEFARRYPETDKLLRENARRQFEEYQKSPRNQRWQQEKIEEMKRRMRDGD